MEIGLRKSQRGLDAFIVFGVLAWMLADAQTNDDVSDVHVQWFSHYSINKPQTLYFGYLNASCGAEHNQNGLCDLFIHMYVPRPFWGIFSQCDFSCLMLVG